MRLVVEIPGNPWAGRVNVRTGMAWSADRRRAKAYLATVQAWTERAVRAQSWRSLASPAQAWMVLYVPDRRRRDLDGPIKAILDGMTKGGAWADDSLVCRLVVDKALGEPRARVLVRAWVDAHGQGVLSRAG